VPRVSHSPYRTLYLPPDDIDVRVPYRFMGSIYDENELEAVRRVMDSQWLTTGLETVEFESEFAEMHGVPYAYAVSSCTSALHLAAQLCRLHPGDEVITTPLTFISTNQAILAQGATVVFADVDERTWNIDPDAVEELITDRTCALFVTHLTGQICDMDALCGLAEQHGLLLVEDCAHTAGATFKGQFAGSFGDAGCFSFHAIKNMTTLGEGGMLTTGRGDFAMKTPWLRSMGSRYPGDPHDDGRPGPRRYEIDDVDGHVPSNVRMSEAQAAVGREQLKKLPGLLARRREIARRWSASLGAIRGISPPFEDERAEHAFHIYAMVVDPEEAGFTNQELHDALLHEHGVQSMPGLYRPSYLFRQYERRGFRPGLCPRAERISENTIQLPLSPHLTNDDVGYVEKAVHQAARSLTARPSVANAGTG